MLVLSAKTASMAVSDAAMCRWDAAGQMKSLEMDPSFKQVTGSKNPFATVEMTGILLGENGGEGLETNLNFEESLRWRKKTHWI